MWRILDLITTALPPLQKILVSFALSRLEAMLTSKRSEEFALYAAIRLLELAKQMLNLLADWEALPAVTKPIVEKVIDGFDEAIEAIKTAK